MKRSALTVTVPVLFAAALGAQSIVSPPRFANVEGPNAFNIPISVPGPGNRLMQVDTNLLGSPRTINGIRFRRDAYAWNTTTAAAVVATVRMSYAATTPATVSPTFADNVVAPAVPVVGLPVAIAATAPQRLPEPFVLDIPFTTPFFYNGTAPLCWDLQVTATTAVQSVGVDAVLVDHGNPAPADIGFGTGCTLTGNNQPMDIHGVAYPNWPSTPSSITFVYTASHLAANNGGFPNPGSVAVLAFGLERLPTAANACTFLIQPLIADVVFVGAGGTLTYPYDLVVPVLPAHNGVDLYAQLLTIDPATNAIAVSDGHQFNISAPFTSQQLGIGMVSGSVAQPTGTAWPDAGVIVEYY